MAGIGGAAAPSRAAADTRQRFVCIEAHCLPYIYDPHVGNLAAIRRQSGGKRAGRHRAFADLLDDWACPICGAGKHRFVPCG